MNRLSTMAFYDRSVAQMTAASERLEKAQTQVATGKRIQTGADDPLQAPIAVKLREAISRREGFQSNIDAARRSLALTETGLGAMSDILIRLREITVQAGDGTLNASDRESLAVEVRAQMDSLMAQMNTKDSDGQYLYSGFKGDTEPFVKQLDGSVIFAGDAGKREIQIAENLSINTRPNGRDTFTRIEAPGGGVTDLISGLDAFADALEGGVSAAALSAAIDDNVEFLNSASDKVNSLRSQTGVSLNLLDAREEALLYENDTDAIYLGEIENADAAEAITEMRLAEATLQASQQTFARIANLSLFNYIN